MPSNAQHSPRSCIAKLTGNVLRYLMGFSLLGYILYRIDLNEVFATFQAVATHWPWLFLAVISTLVALCVAVLRWRFILHALQLPGTLGQTTIWLFVGQFFNTFMPGACGGDVVRAYYLVKASEDGSRAEAGTTVLADRLIGLLTLLLLANLIALLFWSFFMTSPLLRWAALMATLLSFIAGAFIWAGYTMNLSKIPFLKWGLKKTNTEDLFQRVVEALRVLGKNKKTILGSVFYSLLNTVFLTLSWFFCAKALGLTTALPAFFIAFPFITLLAAVPLTPGGLGLREGLFVSMFTLFNMPMHTAFSLSVLVYMVGLLCGLPGWILFLFHKPDTRFSIREELKQR